MRRSPRRAWLGALAATALLSGCGFALRAEPELPFTRIALVGFAPRSPLAAELRERLLSRGVQVLESPAQAEVVLRVLDDRREKSVVASTAAGQVRELQLRVRLGFRIESASGRLLAEAAELLLQRDMSTSERYALAKQQEEAELYTAMQTDIVLQVLRRLARVPLTQ